VLVGYRDAREPAQQRTRFLPILGVIVASGSQCEPPSLMGSGQGLGRIVHDPVGAQHADRKHFPLACGFISFISFISFGTPPQ
jgi:hypothetical protein